MTEGGASRYKNVGSPISNDGPGNAGVILGIRARENARAFFHQSLEFGLKITKSAAMQYSAHNAKMYKKPNCNKVAHLLKAMLAQHVPAAQTSEPGKEVVRSSSITM